MAATTYSTTNLRAAPDARATILQRLNSGVSVAPVGRDDSGQWLYVEVNQALSPRDAPQQGWLPIFALNLTFDVLLLPIASEITPPAVLPGGETEETDLAPRAAAYGRVNVRAAPSIDAEVITVFDTGVSVPVAARSSANNDWLLVETDEGSGWVAYFTVRVEGNLNNLPILVPDDGSGALIPPALVVRTQFNARLHQAASLDSSIVAVVPFDVEVTPIARSADQRWLYIRYQNVLGWGAAGLFAIDAEALDSLPLYVVTPGSMPVVSPTLMPRGAG